MAAGPKPRAAYELVRRIGEGAFGKADLMKRRADGKQCVLKEVLLSSIESQQELNWARQEVELLRHFDHQCIVHYLDSFVDAGSLCIVMEFCDGGDLSKRIEEQRSRGPFAEELVADWFGQLCLALKYVHDRRVIHRDIKPENVFLMSSGNVVKLGDFGVSRTLDFTKQLAITDVGTPLYASPEIVTSKPYNNKTDVWSLGCVLYELLTLSYAFDGSTQKQLFMNIELGKVLPISASYSSEMRRICSAMLRKKPSERPSIGALLKNDSLRPALLKRVSADELAVIQKPAARPAATLPSQSPPKAVAAARNDTKRPSPSREADDSETLQRTICNPVKQLDLEDDDEKLGGGALKLGGDGKAGLQKRSLPRSADDVNDVVRDDAEWDDDDGLPVSGVVDPAVLAERLREELEREVGLELLLSAYDLAERIGPDPFISEADTERQVRAALGENHAALYERLMLLVLYDRRAAE